MTYHTAVINEIPLKLTTAIPCPVPGKNSEEFCDKSGYNHFNASNAWKK